MLSAQNYNFECIVFLNYKTEREPQTTSYGKKFAIRLYCPVFYLQYTQDRKS